MDLGSAWLAYASSKPLSIKFSELDFSGGEGEGFSSSPQTNIARLAKDLAAGLIHLGDVSRQRMSGYFQGSAAKADEKSGEPDGSTEETLRDGVSQAGDANGGVVR